MIRHTHDNLSESSKRKLRLGLLREEVPANFPYGPGNGWHYDPDGKQSVPNSDTGSDDGTEDGTEGTEDGTATGTFGTDGPTWCFVNGHWVRCNPGDGGFPKPYKKKRVPRESPFDDLWGPVFPEGTDGGPTPGHKECPDCPPIGPFTVAGAWKDGNGHWWHIVNGQWVPCLTCGPGGDGGW